MAINGEGTTVPSGVDGVRNFRDAGGVGGLRTGVLYRSGALHAMSEKGARELAGLGVRTVVDLRSRPEVADRPDALHGAAITHLHLPVFTEQRWPRDQMELYPSMAERSGRAVLAVLRHLSAGGEGPVLVHCASGKDRTGVVVALVQTLFGASEADTVADFVRSNTELGLHAAPPSDSRGHNILPVTAAHLRRAFLWIRGHHGSVPACLRAQGATEEELALLPGSA
ncbi:tyrosine-protein phosphatase [Streptomyces sp. SHP 1-2]|uniref:tyrosine-protein phosphatase n=1 Tax=Streptomyces sp. SHP 1-2 TaxID=2769489 RepID=UPI002238999A|nr:tyrosine-protein phosphatase [Streptomyces sp. SHP 1-2]MCW5253545.1 tyrosine-protein phosphatase [Streptomyces sp. SHP 1-2]